MLVIEAKIYVKYHNSGYWITDTRVSLDSIVYAFRNGMSPESIIQSFPVLTLEEVYGAIAFYLANRDEIDAYLRVEEEEFDAMPQPLQARDPSLYNRLISTKAQKQGLKA
ncbi:MAG: DUF433 domain-containing protein [Rhizonema sp. PD37]|nr:DUF433 domain-containing protein [Rhizonema sp. PD37]